MKRQREKLVQAHGTALLRSIGAAIYVLGTRRPRGEHQGTCQTAGICDVIAFLPPPRYPTHPALGAPGGVVLMVEFKAEGGRPSPAQLAFEDNCRATATPYVRGDLHALADWLIKGGWLRESSLPAHHREVG